MAATSGARRVLIDDEQYAIGRGGRFHQGGDVPLVAVDRPGIDQGERRRLFQPAARACRCDKVRDQCCLARIGRSGHGQRIRAEAVCAPGSRGEACGHRLAKRASLAPAQRSCFRLPILPKARLRVSPRSRSAAALPARTFAAMTFGVRAQSAQPQPGNHSDDRERNRTARRVGGGDIRVLERIECQRDVR